MKRSPGLKLIRKTTNTNSNAMKILLFSSDLPLFWLRAVTLIMISTAFVFPAFAQEYTANEEHCMLKRLKNGQADMTIGDIRSMCTQAKPDVALVEPEPTENLTDASPESTNGRAQRRMEAERKAAASPFSILAHKPNYFLLAAYNARGWDPSVYQEASNDPDYVNEDIEGQFQISLKVPLALDLFNGHMDIYGAYTNRSFWQLYNKDHSEPFRESNHEPELWLQFANDWQVGGFTNVVNTFGFVHQSNGRADLLSRSWNRLYAHFIFEKQNLVLSFKPWVWITRDKSASDNPDITDYLGHGEFRTAWRHKGHVYSMMLRNQLESGFERGAVELSWSIPVFNYPYLQAYVQYFYGYGESLIDYNRKVNRIGVGISVTDWID